MIAGYSHPEAILKANFDAAAATSFLDFVEANGLHSFYWRLDSFHRHAFKGNDHSLPGLKADVQGMALVVEHVAAALGACRSQLDDKFKELWAGNRAVTKLLKDNRFMKIGDGRSIRLEWHAERQAGGPNERVAADLAIAYAIRGGAHRAIACDDPLELERMMLILIRAAVSTFLEVRRPSPDTGRETAAE